MSLLPPLAGAARPRLRLSRGSSSSSLERRRPLLEPLRELLLREEADEREPPRLLLPRDDDVVLDLELADLELRFLELPPSSPRDLLRLRLGAGSSSSSMMRSSSA